MELFHQVRFHLFVLSILVVGLNLNTVGNHYVLDDRKVIVENPHFKDTSFISTYFTKGFCEGIFSKCAYYRPFVALSYLADYRLWGNNFRGFHLTNVFIHLTVVLLFYCFVFLAFQSKTIAWVSALLFAVHPIHTESVAWLAARTDPLAAVFILGSMIFFHFYLERDASRSQSPWEGQRGFLQSHQKSAFYILSLIFFVFALLTKEISIFLPVLLLGYAYVFNCLHQKKRLTIKHLFLSGGRFFYYLPFAVFVFLYFIIRGKALGYLILGEEPADIFWERWFLIPYVIWEYFYRILVPYPLFIFRPSPVIDSVGDVRFWGSCLFLIIFISLGMLSRKTRLGIGFGMLWFLISMVPFLFIVVFSDLGPDERFAYIPSMGYAIVIGCFYQWGRTSMKVQGKRWMHHGMNGLLVITVILFGVFTSVRNQDWKDEIVLWDGHYRWVPNSPVGHNNLGLIYLERGELGLALSEYRKHVGFFPESSSGYYHLGLVYQQMGDLEKAAKAYHRVLELGVGDRFTLYNLGLIYKEFKKLDKASHFLRMSIVIDPQYYWSRLALGEVLFDSEDWAGAFEQYEAALTLRENDPISHLQLSRIYQELGDQEKSMFHYKLFLQNSKNAKIKKSEG